MKFYTLNELEKISKNGSYKFLGLFTPDGKPLLHYNGIIKDRSKRWNEIKERLTSKGLPDGLYIVQMKNSIRKDCIPDSFCFKQGDVKEDQIPAIPAIPAPVLSEGSEKVLSWSSALELRTENERLKLELAQAKKDLDFKEERIAEMEAEFNGDNDDPDQEPDSLSQGGQGLIQGLLPSLIPALDKFFSQRDAELILREKELEIKKIQLTQGLPGSGSNGSQEPGSQEIPDPKIDPQGFMRYLGAIAERDPQEYERLLSKYQDVL